MKIAKLPFSPAAYLMILMLLVGIFALFTVTDTNQALVVGLAALLSLSILLIAWARRKSYCAQVVQRAKRAKIIPTSKQWYVVLFHQAESSVMLIGDALDEVRLQADDLVLDLLKHQGSFVVKIFAPGVKVEDDPEVTYTCTNGEMLKHNKGDRRLPTADRLSNKKF